MATRKLNFQRFKEGDSFSTPEIDRRFDQLEIDLNKEEDGLHTTTMSEGALNYQHLQSPGIPATSDYNFGSTIVELKSVRNDPTNHPDSWQRYNAPAKEELWIDGRGQGWSLEKGGIIGDSRYPVSAYFNPQKMEFTVNDLKMGLDYVDDPDYTTGILLMFNTFVAAADVNDGMGIELQVKTGPTFEDGYYTVSEWAPIKGCGRWVWEHYTNTSSSLFRYSAGQPICIRAFLTRARIYDSAVTTNPAITENNLVIKGFRAKIGVIGNSGSGKQYIYLRDSSLTAMALRARKMA